MSESATVTPTVWVYDGEEWMPLLFVLMFACAVGILVSLIYLCSQCCDRSGSHYYHSNDPSERSDNRPQTIENNSDPHDDYTSDSYGDSY